MRARAIGLIAIVALLCATSRSFGLSEQLASPRIFWPRSFDAGRARAVDRVLQDKQYKFLTGLISYWPPEWSTTLVYDGDAATLQRFIAERAKVRQMRVRVTFARDASKETGSALAAGSWWVKYSHATPDVVEVRVNLASQTLDASKLQFDLAP